MKFTDQSGRLCQSIIWGLYSWCGYRRKLITTYNQWINLINNFCCETPPVKKLLATPKNIFKKHLKNQAIKPNFCTNKATTTATATVKKITA